MYSGENPFSPESPAADSGVRISVLFSDLLSLKYHICEWKQYRADIVL